MTDTRTTGRLVILLSPDHFGHHVLIVPAAPSPSFIRDEFLVRAIGVRHVGLSPAFSLLLLFLAFLGIAGGSTSHFLAPLRAAGLVAMLGWRGTFVALSAPAALLGVRFFSDMEGSAILTPIHLATIDRCGFRWGSIGLASVPLIPAVLCAGLLLGFRAHRKGREPETIEGVTA